MYKGKCLIFFYTYIQIKEIKKCSYCNLRLKIVTQRIINISAIIIDTSFLGIPGLIMAGIMPLFNFVNIPLSNW